MTAGKVLSSGLGILAVCLCSLRVSSLGQLFRASAGSGQHSHFRETLGFSLGFGALAGWFLSLPRTGRSSRCPTAAS